ncbi:GNAT family N-acetyltransferase [Mycobacterium sp. 94-17]|uniref:GNAT family N-acetyltransferase n=1 Tax=Mycobacterium sp. 94-17 TaxID=2986147 RepID=UPI002D1E62B7|nr:GNAT family N-acetyltransferase [Mycobacterium sp. 94-17]MEB4211790.1 GNAT family N-acetyltransferase [Mycobacterium sp. 94-17]
MSRRIRRAAPQDAAAIAEMIHALAAFEHAADQCSVTETQIAAALFDEPPTVHGHVAELDGEVAAMALWFLNFSTWDGAAGIYLEDLFVRPKFRRRGLARALMGALAAECLQRGYTRLSWAVLNWNADAIALYDGIGGEPLNEWTTYRLSGAPLAALAESP